MDIRILAKSSFAILASVAAIAIVGYITTGLETLLNLVYFIVAFVVFGSIVIAAFIHGPRFARQ